MEGFTSKYTDEQVEALLDVVAEGGGSTGGGNYEYFLYPGSESKDTDPFAYRLFYEASIVRMEIEDMGGVLVGPIALAMEVSLSGSEFKYLAYGVDLDRKVVRDLNMSPCEKMSVRDSLRNFIMNQYGNITVAEADEYIAQMPRITEEEFYTI